MRPERGQPIHESTRTRRSVCNVIIPIAAGLILAGGVSLPAEAAPAQASVSGDRETETGPIVIGTGPNAVYVGGTPTFGGDPARGETDDSYHARTGRHLPGLSSATAVEGLWWYGRAPVTGGDPAPGETADSYSARTGRDLPGLSSSKGNDHDRS